MQRQSTLRSYIEASDRSQTSAGINSNDVSERLEQGSLKLIPWEEIWHSLRDARIRGQGEMIEVFYETLFKEAVFDDAGAWSQAQSKHSKLQQHRST